MKKIIVFLLLFLITTPLYSITKEETEYFEKNVRPVLVDKCYKCHSSTSKKVKGDLLLDTKEGTLKGGKTGPAVVPNNIHKSLIVKAIEYNDTDLQMPPDSKLSQQEIKNLTHWIEIGAPDPRLASPILVYKPISSTNHWSYLPIKKPTVPSTEIHWSDNPIDNFIYNNLKLNELKPSYIADDRILIRRAYYDLIGLPPTESEIISFINDSNSNKWEILIDRLLSSPEYGERYGRHWLDTSRYSDTTGTVNVNQEPRYTYSYTYRDYVIKSFNTDKPFNQFILEQIAADKLNTPKENLAALGFLTLGKNSGNANDVIDDRIDVITKGFMATTVVCARCHDHKFDPISTKDYYALHGILNSSYVPSDEGKPIISEIKQTKEYIDYLKEKSKVEEEIRTFIDDKYKSAISDFTTNTAKYLYGGYLLNNVAESNRVNFVRENSLNPRMIQRWGQSIKVSLSVSKRQNLKGKGSYKGEIGDVFIPYAKMFKISSKDFEKEFKIMISENEEIINPFLLRHIKELQIRTMNDLSQAYQSAVMESLRTTSANIIGLSEFKSAIFKNNGPLEFDKDTFQKYYSDNGKTMKYDNELRQQRGKLTTLEISNPATPKRAMVLLDKDSPSNSNVLIKGDPNTRGPLVPRRFIETFNYLNPNNFTNGSGRLELAYAIANDKNPLTARVIVNRIWMDHFGEGLVKTPDDFGTQTEKPVQYDLMNYLSSYLIENNWSIKKLNKLIMTSSTYQQSSANAPKKFIKDPNNTLYWRMNIIRLDFEELRDSIFYVSGTLDLKMGGQSVDLWNSSYSNRRTVYGMVDRGRLPEIFTTFDFATPEMTTGKRFQTTVPKQALFLMNNSIIIDQTKHIFNMPKFSSQSTDEEKIKVLYEICYQRLPTQSELKLSKHFIQDGKMDDLANKNMINCWERLIQLLLLGNEMVFIS